MPCPTSWGSPIQWLWLLCTRNREVNMLPLHVLHKGMNLKIRLFFCWLDGVCVCHFLEVVPTSYKVRPQAAPSLCWGWGLLFKTPCLFCSQLLQPAEGLWIGDVLELRIYSSASLHRCSNYTGQSKQIKQRNRWGLPPWAARFWVVLWRCILTVQCHTENQLESKELAECFTCFAIIYTEIFLPS